MAKRTRRLTYNERDKQRARDRERLKQACEQLVSSEGWQRRVRACARNGLARYSVSNLCLILLANPQASFVACQWPSVSPQGRPLKFPAGTASQPLTGDSHAALLELAAAFAASLGFEVAFECTPCGIGGWCDHQRRRIVIDADIPE